jgi:pimeloyl-ACP methyl ester carboxylesterase
MKAGVTKRVLRSGSGPQTFSEEDLEIFDAPMRTDEGARTTQAMYRTFLLRELTGLAAGDLGNARTEVPVRLLVGEEDLIGKQTDLSGFEDHASRMRAEKVAGAGHFLPEERPELVIEHARELFDPR